MKLEMKILAVWIGFGVADVVMISVFFYYLTRIDIGEMTARLHSKVESEGQMMKALIDTSDQSSSSS